jgi:hypothetical protein
MQNKEDDRGNFVFNPSEFLSTTQIKSYFSRLARAQRQRGSQATISSKTDDDELDGEETEEIENEFDSISERLREDSIQSSAEQVFNESQRKQDQ